MRIYIEGTLSVAQETFLPDELWFSNDECEDNTLTSKNCVCLYGESVDSYVEGKTFTVRWKGVILEKMDNGTIVEINNPAVNEVLAYLKANKMRLTNMTASYDTNVKVNITKFILEDYENRQIFDNEKIDEIEFVI